VTRFDPDIVGHLNTFLGGKRLALDDILGARRGLIYSLGRNAGNVVVLVGERRIAFPDFLDELMFAAMTRAAERWRAVGVSAFERRQMVKLREELDHEYEAQIGLKKPTSKEKTANQLSSTSRT